MTSNWSISQYKRQTDFEKMIKLYTFIFIKESLRQWHQKLLRFTPFCFICYVYYDLPRIILLVMLNCQIVLFCVNSSDPKGKFSIYAFIINNSSFLFFVIVGPQSLLTVQIKILRHPDRFTQLQSFIVYIFVNNDSFRQWVTSETVVLTLSCTIFTDSLNLNITTSWSVYEASRHGRLVGSVA